MSLAEFLDKAMPGSEDGKYSTRKIELVWQRNGEGFRLTIHKGSQDEIISGLERLGWREYSRKMEGFILVKNKPM